MHTGCLKKPSPELFLCFLDKNGCLNPVHPPKWQVTDPKRVLAAHGHQRNPFIASSGVRSMLFLRSFREKFCIVFIRTNFPPNSVIKIRIIFFIMFSALLNHIKVLRTEIRLPVATICAFKTFLKQFSSLYAETRVLRADAFRAFGVFASNHWPLHVGQSLKGMWASFHIKFKPSTYYITQIKRKQKFFID